MTDGEAWDAPPPADEDECAQAAPAAEPPRRALCARCHRPVPRECVCDALPASPLDTLGCVVIVQHPHEHRRAFATVPLLQAALANCWVVRARAHSPGAACCAPLQAVLDAAADAHSPLPVFVLWPGADAVAAEEAAAALAPARAAAAAARALHPAAALEALSLRDRLRRCAYALVLPDGTWQQTREMMHRLRPCLLPPGRLLRLPRGEGGLPSPEPQARLLTEPAEGCMMTAEAVAHAMACMEAQPPLLQALLAPLRAMLALQARHGMPAKGVKHSKRQLRLKKSILREEPASAADTAARDA